MADYIGQEINPAIKVEDQGNSQILDTNGAVVKGKYDFFKVKTNDSALTTNVRQCELQAYNDYSTYASVWPKISGKGNVGLYIPSGAAAPTWAAYMEGSLYYDNGAHKLMVATNAAWVVAGSQS